MEPSLRKDRHQQASTPAQGAVASSRARWSRWTSPLVLTLWAATLAVTGNAWVTYADGAARRGLERSQAEAALALQAVRSAGPGDAARNLRFLLEAGLVADPERRAALAAWLEAAGQPVAWPSGDGTAVPPPGGERLVPAQFRMAEADTRPPAAPDADAEGGIEAYGDPRLGPWADSAVPARFGRFTSGLKVGDAVSDRGATGQSQTWLADIGLPGGSSWDWMARARITALSTNSVIGGTFGARTTGNGKGKPLGLVAAAVNDSPNAVGAIGIYSETMMGPRSTSGASGVQFNFVNASKLGAAGNIRPYGPAPRGMAALSLAAGGDVRVHGRTAPISAFALFRDNGAKAKAGLVFKSNALERLGDPRIGYGEAVSLPQGYGLSWYGGTDQAEVFRLSSAIGDARHAQALSFRDDGARLVRGLGAATALYVPFVPGSVNYVQLSPAAAGNPAAVAARGDDKSIDLRLDPKGGGTLDLGIEAKPGAVKPTYRARVKIDGVAYYLPLAPA